MRSTDELANRNEVLAGGVGQAKQNQQVQMQTRIAILETREKQLNRKLETAMNILNHANQSQIEVSKQHKDLEKQWTQLTEDYLIGKQRIRELEDQLRNSIHREESRRIQTRMETLETELTETKAALLSYKNMNETVSDQVKSLKLILERRKDENENLVNAVRELSS
jgi:chromosome segregation ATPase